MDYEVIGDFVVHYEDSFTTYVVNAYTDKVVKKFTGETSHSKARRWAWDNSPNPHIR